MHTELEALLAVQRQDLERLEHERKVQYLEDRKAQLVRQLAQITARHQALHDALEAKRIEAQRLASEVDHLDEHIRNQEKKLETEIVSLKEVEAIKTSLEHGHRHVEKLEEGALALMEEVELEAERLQAEDASFAKRQAQFEAEIVKLDREVQVQRGHISTVNAARQALWDELPERSQALYERLLRSFPDPLAPLEGPTCGSCHLQVSAQLVEQVRHGGGLVPCEHCGRILYLR